ncbi:MAG: RNA methyltransferase [Myxococcales bacterium]|nr:RNA methyltransferase [Myxococcales bacterium]
MPTFATLTSASDPRFEPFRDLRDRDARGRDGEFIVEGEVVLRAALAARPELVRVVLLLDKRREKLADALALLPETTPVLLADEATMSEVVGFPIHRGILALARRPAPVTARDLLGSVGPRAVVVGISGVTNHDNVGGIFRSAAAFGASAVVLDRASCDPLYRKALRVSVGASCRVPFAFVDSEAELVDALVDAGFTPYALSPRGAEDLRDVRIDALPERVALVCGAEGPGLSDVTLERVRGLRMTMAEGWDSLNVSVAAGIALHAMSRAPLRSRTT